MLKKFFNIITSYTQIHPIKQKEAFHHSNTLTTMRCLFKANTRCGWIWNYMWFVGTRCGWAWNYM